MRDQDQNYPQRETIFSKPVKAGKRTYFFDVKATRANEFYLTITESKIKFNPGEEKPFYEKHKIFLYKEDFDKFLDGLNEAVTHIKTEQPYIPREERGEAPSTDNNPFTDIKFDETDK